ncbi:hypothetical protein [Emticicia agri]|uniref:PsbP C-terminal domain-containing protein n=1 Tax=Emticicia agri TaxID=2492393 RepID=A0A4Q5LTC0_9BACT|nr:hypothetical protein [Emticicia agri]RYU92804.1 hypothetical protein EWM59_25355 [Emticicia agri]
MKITKKVFIIFLTLVTVTSAYSQTKFTEQKAGHVYHVSIPDYMTKSVTLNDVATMQYINSAKNAYLVIIDDSKEELEMKGIKFASLKEFHDDNIKHLKGEENDPVESKGVEFEANGNKFYQSELSVNFKEKDDLEVKITYLITYVETKGYYYQILCWSLTPEYKNLLADFKKIAASIRD